MTLNDRVHYAETRLTLLAVERDYSYKSMDNWQQVLSSCDPGSEVLRKIVMNENKVSHIVSFGLYPNMRDEMIKRVRNSYFTMGVDASVIHQLGILKYVDIHLRYWSETAGRVEDASSTHTQWVMSPPT